MSLFWDQIFRTFRHICVIEVSSMFRHHRPMMPLPPTSSHDRLVRIWCRLVKFTLIAVALSATAQAQELPENHPFTHLFTADSDPFALVSTGVSEDASILPAQAGLDLQAQKPPEPSHTGFKALVIETGRDFKAY